MKLFVRPVKNILSYNIKNSRSYSFLLKHPPWNVLFFGADEFSLYSLKALHKEFIKGILIKNLEVVSTFRGIANPVYKFAENHNLAFHSWPVTVPENKFHLGLVISFGHLIPELIIEKFPFGMINVHASLLPRWRGAAPIIYALANGDKETGVTIMRLKAKHFDIGEIVLQERIPITNDMIMPELHEKLGHLGAACLIKSLTNLTEYLNNCKIQPDVGVTFAPKVTLQFTSVNWKVMTSTQVYNLGRALVGFALPLTTWNGTLVKLQDVKDCGACDSDSVLSPGFVKYCKMTKTLRIICANQTSVSVKNISVFGKKIMTAIDFNNGYVKKEPLDRRYFK